MPEFHSIQRILVRGYRQFSPLELNFPRTEDGQESCDICILGFNGTGKSALLDQIARSTGKRSPVGSDSSEEDKSLILTKFSLGEQSVYQARPADRVPNGMDSPRWFTEDIEGSEQWEILDQEECDFATFSEAFASYEVEIESEGPSPVPIYIGPEWARPESSSESPLQAFLDYKAGVRETQFFEYLHRPENEERTVKEIREDFAETFPDRKFSYEAAWKPVLDEIGIRFLPGKRRPFRTLESGEIIQFREIGTAIQRLLIRLAIAADTCAECETEPRFVFLDEPSEGLHPAISAKVLDWFHEVLPDGTQCFSVTHDPILASQFPEQNRVRLIRENDGRISASAGIAPIGGSPNQILTKDFQLNPSGQDRRQQADRLKKSIQDSDDRDELADLIDEVMSL